ncbi:MAG: ribose 5-phosphate isomerase B [Lachnospiraceae bacterium]|nr:ribose 5-phosphate isomerase B [Lachnospiraceae bacterium]
MKIGIGADHGGYDLKEMLKEYLSEKGYEIKDFGTFSKESCDYPDFAHQVAHAVAKGELEKGILICTTGVGISIAANKVPGIRAALCSDPLTASLCREHNDANILALGAHIIGPGLARNIADIFLTTEFSKGERHVRRVGKIEQIDE